MNRVRVKYLAFAVFAALILYAVLNMRVNPGVSQVYNSFGTKIAPNMVTVILFDFRGYDTLGECVILVAGILALTMLYGRGLINSEPGEKIQPQIKTTTLLSASSKMILPFVIALGIYTTFGGHITPGGGFQGG